MNETAKRIEPKVGLRIRDLNNWSTTATIREVFDDDTFTVDWHDGTRGKTRWGPDEGWEVVLDE